MTTFWNWRILKMSQNLKLYKAFDGEEITERSRRSRQKNTFDFQQFGEKSQLWHVLMNGAKAISTSTTI